MKGSSVILAAKFNPLIQKYYDNSLSHSDRYK